MLTVGEISAEKGVKKSGFLTIVDKEGFSVEIPVILINGMKPGPVLWINAGIHGAEYSGIEAAIRISTDITPQKLSGALIILPIVNIAGFFSRSIYICPIDNKNLNRVFPGKKDGSLSEIIAYTLIEEIAPKVSYLIDLHGGDMVEALYPFVAIKKTGEKDVDTTAEDLAIYYGIKTVIEITEDAVGWTGEGTLFATMAKRGVPALLAEAGGVGQLDETSVSMHYNGLINVMKYLGMLEAAPTKPEGHEFFNDFIWLYSSHQGIFYAKVKAGDKVTVGQPVGEVRDYFGRILETIASPVEGRVLFLVSSPATKENGLVMGIGKASNKA